MLNFWREYEEKKETIGLEVNKEKKEEIVRLFLIDIIIYLSSTSCLEIYFN